LTTSSAVKDGLDSEHCRKHRCNRDYSFTHAVRLPAHQLYLESPPHPFMAGSTINYVPTIYQSLHDLAAWVEKDIAPPASTGYVVNDGQVELAAKAEDRHGIQPVASPSVNGSTRIEVEANQPVEFTGPSEAPPGAGKVVGTGWFLGEGTPKHEIKPIESMQSIDVTKAHWNICQIVMHRLDRPTGA